MAADDAVPPTYASAQQIRRMLGAKNWFDPAARIVRKRTFIRRPPRPDGREPDANGISVVPADIVSVEDCLASMHFTCFGVAVLSVGAVRLIGEKAGRPLDVVPDKPDHGNIVGLPYPIGEDIGLAEHLAGQIANCAVLEWPEVAADS
jgi:hypothetical protein